MPKKNISTLDRRNTIHVYVREEDKPMFNMFLQYIEKDKRFEDIRTRTKGGLMSIALMMLANKYCNDIEDGKIPGITSTTVKKLSKANGGDNGAEDIKEDSDD
jgi:hypothetical protein